MKGNVVCDSHTIIEVFFCFMYEIILTKLFENIVSIVDCGNHKLNFCEFPIHGLLLLDVLKHESKIKIKKKKFFMTNTFLLLFSVIEFIELKISSYA